MKNKRICVFLERWESGGIESVIASTLARRPSDVEVDVVAEMMSESIFTERLAASGVGFIELSGTLRSRKNYSMFKRLLEEKKYDALHLNIFHGVAMKYAKIAKELGVPVRVAHAHGAGLRNSLTKPLKLALHRMARTVYGNTLTGRLACSEAAGRFLFGNADFTVIGNGVDTDKFRYSEKKRNEVREALGINGVLLGTVGRLSPEKNQIFAVEVLAEYKKIRPDARLLITGEGETRDMLASRAMELGVYGDTIFLGASREVEGLMLAMDLMLFPSTVEGFGIVAVEAATSALPVICSTGVPECVAINERTVHLPLEAGAEAWAREAERLITKYPDRRDMTEDVRRRGFCAEESAARILGYLGVADE